MEQPITLGLRHITNYGGGFRVSRDDLIDYLKKQSEDWYMVGPFEPYVDKHGEYPQWLCNKLSNPAPTVIKLK